MDSIKYRSKTYNGPASWKDCTQAMFQRLIPFCRLPKDAIIDDFIGMAVQLIFSIMQKDWNTWVLGLEQWEAIKKQTAWVFEMPEERPFESFTHIGKRYILMDEFFANTSALELSMAMMAYTDFAHPDEPDLTAIDRLIATIARPERINLKAFQKSDLWDGDLREPFNETRMLANAKELATVPLELKTVILTYYEMQAKQFLEQYSELFGGEAEPRYGDGRGWIMLLKNIAKEGHFGNFDDVCRQPAHLVFVAALDDTITAQEAQDQQSEENY